MVQDVPLQHVEEPFQFPPINEKAKVALRPVPTLVVVGLIVCKKNQGVTLLSKNVINIMLIREKRK